MQLHNLEEFINFKLKISPKESKHDPLTQEIISAYSFPL